MPGTGAEHPLRLENGASMTDERLTLSHGGDIPPNYRALHRWQQERRAEDDARKAHLIEIGELEPDPTWEDVESWRGRRGARIMVLKGVNQGVRIFMPGKGLSLPGGSLRQTLRLGQNPRELIREAQRLDKTCLKWSPVRTEEQEATDQRFRRLLGEVFRTVKKRAKLHGVECTLTIDDVEDLYWKQEGMCAVSGLPFSTARASPGSFRAPMRPSLDRIQPAQGYIKGNVRLVLTLVNLAMNDWGESPLIDVARAIVAKHDSDA